MQAPTFDDFVQYQRVDPPDEDGMCRCYQLMGLKDHQRDNHVYLWRNYNTFDAVSTEVPAGYVLQHNGYQDCDKCNEGDKCCPEHRPTRSNHMQKYRFGTKVFAENYVPTPPNHQGRVYKVHDNGGRPFKVYVDSESKKIHVYALNRNLIYESASYRKEYSHTNIVMFPAGTEVQLAMNPNLTAFNNDESSDEKSSGCEENSDEKASDGAVATGDMEDNMDNITEGDGPNTEENKMDQYYDQHIVSLDYLRVWIPCGSYLTRDDSGKVVEEIDEYFWGNSILAQIGDNEYLYIGTSVRTFCADDRIERYFSLVGNSDVPYPVAIGTKYLFFMESGPCAEPFEKYKNLNFEQLSNAYPYYYGHVCTMCHQSDCDCKVPEYAGIICPHVVLCERDW